MDVPGILVLLICAQYGAGYRLRDTSEGFKWPANYHLKAEKIDLDSGILESMEIWSVAAANRFRIDYYGGMVKNYYYLQDDGNMTVYRLVPTSTEGYQNKIMCLAYKKKVEDVQPLPLLEHYKFTGEEELEGKQVEVWKYEMVYKKEMSIDRTLYTYPSDEGAIPVRYEEKNYSNVKGALTVHTITNYYEYESTVNETDVDKGDTKVQTQTLKRVSCAVGGQRPKNTVTQLATEDGKVSQLLDYLQALIDNVK